MSTLADLFTKELKGTLQQKLGIKTPMRVPKLTKIVVNVGVKDALADKKNIEKISGVLTQITGQKPKVAKARKSIAGFKLRQGDPVGLMVTLRGKRMYDFYEKLTKIVFPRIRDFRGVKKTSFDGKGNYSLGVPEYIVFPEIDPSKVEKMQGLEVIIVTTAQNREEGLALLEVLGMPYEK